MPILLVLYCWQNINLSSMFFFHTPNSRISRLFPLKWIIPFLYTTTNILCTYVRINIYVLWVYLIEEKVRKFEYNHHITHFNKSKCIYIQTLDFIYRKYSIHTSYAKIVHKYSLFYILRYTYIFTSIFTEIKQIPKQQPHYNNKEVYKYK